MQIRFICHLLSDLRCHSTTLSPLVRIMLDRFPKLRRIFYYDYCSFEEATHVAAINYDDEISIN